MVTNVDDMGTGSLRQALMDANANSGLDSIHFDIPSTPPVTIQLFSTLPPITDPVVLDGTTQPGYVDRPLIEVDCRYLGLPSTALTITAGNSTIRGLILNRFSQTGIDMTTAGYNRVEGNYIGTVADGSAAASSYSYGVRIFRCGHHIIGGDTPQKRNVISGAKGGTGIHISDDGNSHYNVIAGNYIGVNAQGTAALPNQYGIILYRTGNNTIGGTQPGERNIISGNTFMGILISHTWSSYNSVIGNYIGTDTTGMTAIPNNYGIQLNDGTQYNTIGGTDASRRNLISGNNNHGIHQKDTKGNGNFFLGNWIGVDATGEHPLPNQQNGIRVDYSYYHTIGGTQPGAGNVISGNLREGISLSGAASNSIKIQGNYIGTNPNGTSLGNGGSGILLASGACYNLIGGMEPGAGNVIAYNTPSDETVVPGIQVLNDGTRNTILSNSIYANSSLGIELGEAGPTLNDPRDADTGANNLQNFPVLTEALTGAGVLITGLLNSTPDTEFTIQFFWNQDCDTSGYGEGQHYIGSTGVLTNADGDTSFSALFYNAIPADGTFVTSTATDSEGNTSEFSQCLKVIAGSVPTQTPTPSPTPSPSPSPSATPGDRSDTDGDGYADWYELLPDIQTDPLNPESHPTLGDVNGDGHATTLDALLLYRQVTGRLSGGGPFPFVDLDYDGDCDAQDALILYRWAIGHAGYEILPHTP